jgi:hypothetical protein
MGEILFFNDTKILKIERGQPHAPDPQRNARLQAKINFPTSGKRGFFFTSG